ncbi:hypothetical protein CP082626L3_1250 [Chlamydia psittaci 08-2626_L3]|nr:hypothetical protein CP082626L3_1250 [Chlamydia psittaci 08-2626_L3]
MHCLFNNPPFNPKIMHFLLENPPFNSKISPFLLENTHLPQNHALSLQKYPIIPKITHFL